MTKSIYIIGGAGTGKSTFMAELLEKSGTELGTLEDLWSAKNSRGSTITLRGHRTTDNGIYLGVMRESFPGTDGLDRVSSVAGVPWLESSRLPRYILGEGATLGNRPFLQALDRHTDLLVVHLKADEFVKEIRFLKRGSNQDPAFVQSTETRADNLASFLEKEGVWVWRADSADIEDWGMTMTQCFEHLKLSSV